MLTFVELPTFARVRGAYLDDDEFSRLQVHLVRQPDAGAVIPGTSGCRKLRWAVSGRGKRGGLRVIYFWRRNNGDIVLLTMYAKSAVDNIAPSTLRALKEAFDAKA